MMNVLNQLIYKLKEILERRISIRNKINQRKKLFKK